jgi:hypothetical protein
MHTYQKLSDGSGYSVGVWLPNPKVDMGGSVFSALFDVATFSEATNAVSFLNGSSVRMSFAAVNERSDSERV